ncbi:MAG TPA: hypothetical protein PK831_00355 [Candidatus Magasanikbacteria bacterium]|jgi:hypothetical protein|nr:hypothetical protein [Candidatus Magasanikbacteria bacterium]HQL52770.1 hypothetical protein [Candidatus Magasanikbacteria bacterium]
MGQSSNFNINPLLEKIHKEVGKNSRWYRSWWMLLIYGFVLGIFASIVGSVVLIKFKIIC